MINLDDPLHKRRRNLVNRGFTPRRVADHEPRIREICRELIAKVAPRGRCDFVQDVAAPLPMIVIGDMLGVEPEDRDQLLRWSDELIEGTSATAPAEVRGAPRAPSASTPSTTAAWSRTGARGRSDDLISVLVHGEIDGERLADDELLQESLLILVGGDETTRHVISGGMEALIRHPEQRALLAREPARIPSGRRGDAALGDPDPEHEPHRHPRPRAARAAHRQGRQAAAALRLGEPRRVGVRGRRSASTSPATRTPTSPSAATGPTTASAPASPASSCA